MPDEFYDWADNLRHQLQEAFNNTHSAAVFRFSECYRKAKDRKEFAQLAMNQDFAPAKLLFGLYDGRDISSMIWDHIKPEYEKPFAK